MATYRCEPCRIDWPAEPDPTIRPPLDPGYEVCAKCGEPCELLEEAPAIDAKTARILKLQLEFDRHCAKRPNSGLDLRVA